MKGILKNGTNPENKTKKVVSFSETIEEYKASESGDELDEKHHPVEPKSTRGDLLNPKIIAPLVDPLDKKNHGRK